MYGWDFEISVKGGIANVPVGINIYNINYYGFEKVIFINFIMVVDFISQYCK